MQTPNRLPPKLISKCEVCNKETEVSLHYGNMYFCDECWNREQKMSEENQSIENQQKRLSEHEQQFIPINDVIRESREIDSNIRVRTDLFNAKTKSILELKSAIDKDESIQNKSYELARVLTERFQYFKTIVFELNEKLIDAGNEQRAIQTYLNTLANQLRIEEREKLKIADINYKPTPPKLVKSRKIETRQTNKKTRINKIELRSEASKLNISEFTLYTICIQKNCSVTDGVKFFKEMMSK